MPQPCPGTACSHSSAGPTPPHRTAPAGTPCPGCALCRRPGTVAALAPCAHLCLCPPQQGETLKPLHGNDGVQWSPVLQQGSTPQLCSLGPAPQTNPPAAWPQLPRQRWGKRLHCPIPSVSGPKGEQLLPPAGSPPSPDTVAESKVCSRLPTGQASGTTRLHPGLWPSCAQGRCLPSRQRTGPSAPLGLPPRAGGVAPHPSSAPRCAAAGQRGQACGTGRAAHCMNGWEPAPCTSLDRRPRESISSDTWIFACRVPGWAPGAASSSKACFGSGRTPRTPDAEVVLHLHLDYIDRGRLLL